MHALSVEPPVSPPHAIPDAVLAARGRALLDGLLAGADFAAMEVAKTPRHITGARLDGAPDAAQLWKLAGSGRIDADDDHIRVVATGTKGLAVLGPEHWTRPARLDGRAIRTPEPEALRALFDRGATIAFQRLDRYDPFAAALASALSAATGHPVQCSAYLSPGRSRALDVHHDTHDVLAVQLEGAKRFRFFETIVPDPLPRIDLSPAQVAAARPVGEAALEKGHALYLPRGVPHCAVAGGGHSLHLTIGFLVQGWATVIEPLARELYYLEPLRRAIPAGGLFAPDDLRRDAALAVEQVIAWLRIYGAERMAALACERFVGSFADRPPWPGRPATPVTAIEPAAGGGEVIVTPRGRRRRTADDGGL